jgi:hypothetical protein
MSWLRAIGVLILTVSALAAQDPVDIMRHVVDRDAQNSDRINNYTYQERTEIRRYSSEGKLKDTESTTTEVLMLAGRPYRRPIAKNDKPLTDAQMRDEADKMTKELVKRQHSAAAEASGVEKRRQQNRKLMHELTDAFIFHMAGQEDVSGKKAWMIQADPNPGYRAKDQDEKILTKLRGKVWVSEDDFQLAKADFRVDDTISMEYGLFRLAPGATVTFEQKRVNDEVWLPMHVLIKGEARLAYVAKIRAEIELTYRDYKKFQADSHVVEAK